MPSTVKEVEAYLEGLPDERREALEAVIAVVEENIDQRFEFGMQYGDACLVSASL